LRKFAAFWMIAALFECWREIGCLINTVYLF
jgi:hypothetical protein